MSEDAKKRALAEEILADARRRAERRLQRARRTADRILETARRQADAVRKEIEEDAERRLERETAAVLADLPHQERLRELQVMEDVIRRQIDEAMAALLSRENYDVTATLVRLGRDAIRQMDGDRFRLEVAAADAEACAGLAEQVAEAVRSDTGRAVQVEVVPSSDVSGGVRVRSGDGRQLVDHSFAARLERMRHRLRTRVAEILFGEDAE